MGSVYFFVEFVALGGLVHVGAAYVGDDATGNGGNIGYNEEGG
jgi:hypothetical protein